MAVEPFTPSSIDDYTNEDLKQVLVAMRALRDNPEAFSTMSVSMIASMGVDVTALLMRRFVEPPLAGQLLAFDSNDV